MSYEIRENAKVKMKNFLDGYGAAGAFNYPDHLPCFINRVNIPGRLKLVSEIRKFFSLALEAHTGKVEVICVSVTERDDNHKKVLSVAEKDGYTIIGPFESIHGNYSCWAIFPVKKFEKETIKRKV